MDSTYDLVLFGHHFVISLSFIYQIFWLGLLCVEFTLNYIQKKWVFDQEEALVTLELNLLSGVIGTGMMIGFVHFYTYCYESFHVLPLPQFSILTWFVGLLCFDFLFYVKHWLHHYNQLFGIFHITHHQSKVLNLFAASRSSVVNQIFLQPLFMWPLAFVGVSIEDLFCVNAIFGLYNYFIHMDVDFKFTVPVLNRFFISPREHLLHHTTSFSHQTKNLGGLFSVWDKLFKTYESPVEQNLVFGARDTVNPRSLFDTVSYYLFKYNFDRSILNTVHLFINKHHASLVLIEFPLVFMVASFISFGISVLHDRLNLIIPFQWSLYFLFIFCVVIYLQILATKVLSKLQYHKTES